MALEEVLAESLNYVESTDLGVLYKTVTSVLGVWNDSDEETVYTEAHLKVAIGPWNDATIGATDSRLGGRTKKQVAIDNIFGGGVERFDQVSSII